jgi:hypothetical protein
VDEAGRLYISQMARGRWVKPVEDAFGLGGGAGFTVFDENLSKPILGGSFGGDSGLCIAVKGDYLVVGGIACKQPKEGEPKKLAKTVNAHQEQPGGGSDGFVAIIKLR